MPVDIVASFTAVTWHGLFARRFFNIKSRSLRIPLAKPKGLPA